MRWILASASPRRRELLSLMGLEFDVEPAQGEETIHEPAPEQAVMELARGKAREILKKHTPQTGETISGAASEYEEGSAADASAQGGKAPVSQETPAGIIAADTIVVLDGQILGKPADEEDAFRMLSSLQGRTHQVYTGVNVITLPDQKETCFFECTDVTFDVMTPEQIKAYIATGEPMDKAGAYGIQGRGGVYITQICGDYYNVVGLPVCRLRKELERIT